MFVTLSVARKQLSVQGKICVNYYFQKADSTKISRINKIMLVVILKLFNKFRKCIYITRFEKTLV